MKFGFIAKHCSIWPVAWLCEALGVFRSGFHAWLGRTLSDRARADEALVLVIRCSFTASAAPMALEESGAFCWRRVCPVACTKSSG